LSMINIANGIKVDKHIVSSILYINNGQEIIKQIVSNLKRHYKTIIAEGVESKEEYNLLKMCGFDLYQGYLFGGICIDNIFTHPSVKFKEI
ncbi:MAG: EAL domain-containing protein, partial [Shewanella oncorhynchi]